MKDFFVLIMCIITVVMFFRWIIGEFKDYTKIHKEWKAKVNNCIMDSNYRNDCKLIIYKDMQNHNMQIQNEQTARITTSAMVGSMIGASMVRR